MASSPPGVALSTGLRAIVRNPADLRPGWFSFLSPSREKGGAGGIFPTSWYLVFEALISVYSSARQVEAELSQGGLEADAADGQEDVP